MSRPMPQKSVMPAKTRPAPTKPDSQMKSKFTNRASNTPVKTSPPAAMRTWRSRLTTFTVLRSTGKFASIHASVPPSTTMGCEKPSFANFSAALSRALAAATQQINRLVFLKLQRTWFQFVQRNTSRLRNVDFRKFHRRAHVKDR
jgi:hypothetical protein